MIDTHAHLDFEPYADDRPQVIQRAIDSGVRTIINIGADMESSRRSVRLADAFPSVWAAVGVHPSDAHQLTTDALAELREMAAHPKVIGIGEIGLDYYWDACPRDVQAKAFDQQLALAAELRLPAIVHDRNAHDDVLRMLEHWTGRVQAVLHCFSGDSAMARRAVEMGLYIGVDGPVTFSNARDLPDIVRSAPMESLLLETDSPFLTPHPYRGKRNEPAHLTLIARTVADLRGLSVAELDDATTQNALHLFGPQIEEPQGRQADDERAESIA